jgi:AcrR family transcriptional regulator
MGLREDKKRETRESIVSTSLALFREQGFDDTRVQDVVRRLRISEGTFFNYFPTKHAVLEEVGADLIDEAIDALRADTSTDSLPVPERLVATIRAFAAGFAGDREFAALLAAHTQFFSGARAERLAKVHLLLTDMFAEGQAAGDIVADVPAVLLADAFLAVTTAMVHTWLNESGPTDSLEDRLLTAVRVVLDGCATTTPTPS